MILYNLKRDVTNEEVRGNTTYGWPWGKKRAMVDIFQHV
jgi:hypothetical protein